MGTTEHKRSVGWTKEADEYILINHDRLGPTKVALELENRYGIVTGESNVRRRYHQLMLIPCKFNSGVVCGRQDKCYKCGWRPKDSDY